MASLEEALSACVEGHADAFGPRLVSSGPLSQVLAAFIDFWQGDFAHGSRRVAAVLTVQEAETAVELRALALGVAALLAAGDPDVAPEPFWQELDRTLRREHPRDRWWAIVHYVRGESYLASARVAQSWECLGDADWIVQVWAGHPVAGLLAGARVRSAAFGGHVAVAQTLVTATAPLCRPGTRIAAAMGALQALVTGNAGHGDATQLAVLSAAGIRHPAHDYLDRGALFLAAYGCIAAGDRSAAAALALNAGCDEELSRCPLIDRALGLELVIEAALAVGDPHDAAAWLVHLEPLATHPITAPTVQRAMARVLLAAGRGDEAVPRLLESIAACAAQGRQVEAAEGHLVLARAQLPEQRSETVRALVGLVRTSDSTGHGAVRRSAEHLLSGSGRRLPPVVGAGWAVLTPREQEVAHLILAGAEVPVIAHELHLSQRTVQVHLSRVLTAFGVPTRACLLAIAGGPRAEVDRPLLSPRQDQVAAGVARGLSNVQLADELGVTVKAIEKHVSDVMVRWGVANRFGVAYLWWRGIPPRTR